MIPEMCGLEIDVNDIKIFKKSYFSSFLQCIPQVIIFVSTEKILDSLLWGA